MIKKNNQPIARKNTKKNTNIKKILVGGATAGLLAGVIIPSVMVQNQKDKSEQDNKKLNNEILEITKDLTSFKNEVSNLKTQNKNKEQNVKDLKSDLALVNKIKNDLTTLSNTLITERDNLKTQLKQEQDKNKVLKDNEGDFYDNLDARDKTIKELRDERDKLTGEVSTLTKDLTKQKEITRKNTDTFQFERETLETENKEIKTLLKEQTEKRHANHRAVVLERENHVDALKRAHFLNIDLNKLKKEFDKLNKKYNEYVDKSNKSNIRFLNGIKTANSKHSKTKKELKNLKSKLQDLKDIYGINNPNINDQLETINKKIKLLNDRLPKDNPKTKENEGNPYNTNILIKNILDIVKEIKRLIAEQFTQDKQIIYSNLESSK